MTLIDLAMLIGGAVLALLGLWSFARVPRAFLDARKEDAESLRATGTVIELTEEPAWGENSLPTWHPVVRFEDDRGHEHTVQVRFGSVPSRWAVGDDVTVAYPASAPEEAEIDHWFMAYQPVLIALLFGLVGCGAGTLLALVALFGD